MKMLANFGLIFFLINLLFPTNYVFGQFVSQEQKKDWFYLQTLSQQIFRKELCFSILEIDSSSEDYSILRNGYYEMITELSDEVELYTTKYSDSNSQNEIPLTYYVWNIIFNQKEKVEINDKAMCKLILKDFK